MRDFIYLETDGLFRDCKGKESDYSGVSLGQVKVLNVWIMQKSSDFVGSVLSVLKFINATGTLHNEHKLKQAKPHYRSSVRRLTQENAHTH